MDTKATPVVPIAEPITGREPPGDPGAPQGALAQFYRAFNSRDLALMEANWDASPDVAMDNPLGGILRGWRRTTLLRRRKRPARTPTFR